MLETGGIELLPALPRFLAFAVAALSLNLVPGADMTYVASCAARGGRRSGVAAALGVSVGCIAHLFAALIGISALLAASQTAFTVLKLVGAVYLLYLAFDLVRSGAPRVNLAEAPHGTARAFRGGVLVNVLNPKVALFFLAFLPQFVEPSSNASLQILALGLWFNVSGTLVNVAVAIIAARAAGSLRASPVWAKLARWLAGGVMAGLAVQLALASRR